MRIGLTRHERLVIFFLIFFAVLGFGIKLYKNSSLYPNQKETTVAHLDSLRQEFLEKSRQITEKDSSEVSQSGKNRTDILQKININKATLAELTQLPRIGPGLGKRIIRFREENGDFRKPGDIVKVRGIGPKTFDEIKHLITVN